MFVQHCDFIVPKKQIWPLTFINELDPFIHTLIKTLWPYIITWSNIKGLYFNSNIPKIWPKFLRFDHSSKNMTKVQKLWPRLRLRDAQIASHTIQTSTFNNFLSTVWYISSTFFRFTWQTKSLSLKKLLKG